MFSSRELSAALGLGLIFAAGTFARAAEPGYFGYGTKATPEQIATWDLHATATPGDYAEISTLRTMLPDSVMVTARKGTFGHGMSAGGGWELTAQYLGYASGHLFPTLLTEKSLNPAIADIHGQYVFADSCVAADGLAGKLSSGIGGINACVISRPLPNTAKAKK